MNKYVYIIYFIKNNFRVKFFKIGIQCKRFFLNNFNIKYILNEFNKIV